MKLRSTHITPTLEFYTPDFSTEVELPYIDAGLRAGFPSPADDFIEISIDINKEYIKNRDTTFFAKVKGDSMVNAGIFDGDLLIIDKSLEPQNDKKNGEMRKLPERKMQVRRLRCHPERTIEKRSN